ncbi:MAG: biopolymer transporter ExbD [Planctomycetota bacterium]
MKKRPQVSGEVVPNLAPMVDVIMVLLVFFLLGTSLDLVKQGVLQTELDPSSGPGAGVRVQVNPLIQIALGDVRDGEAARIMLLDDDLGENAFAELYRQLDQRRLAGADAANPVVIVPETNVRWTFVVQAIDAAVRARFTNIQFAVSLRSGTLCG